MREWLIDGFRYDLWANRLWLPVAGCDWEKVGLPDSDDLVVTDPAARLKDCLTHVLHGQRMWLARLGVAINAEGEDWLDALHTGWVDLVSEHEATYEFEYVRPNGETIARPLGDVGWHLINHGTYHRGQMRETADLAGLDWPETDVTTWRSSTT